MLQHNGASCHVQLKSFLSNEDIQHTFGRFPSTKSGSQYKRNIVVVTEERIAPTKTIQSQKKFRITAMKKWVKYSQ